jgi:hypothetical protein
MRGWVLVQPDGVEEDDQLNRWIQRAVKFVGKLPGKWQGETNAKRKREDVGGGTL